MRVGCGQQFGGFGAGVRLERARGQFGRGRVAIGRALFAIMRLCPGNSRLGGQDFVNGPGRQAFGGKLGCRHSASSAARSVASALPAPFALPPGAALPARVFGGTAGTGSVRYQPARAPTVASVRASSSHP